jgi:hypothetical protein
MYVNRKMRPIETIPRMGRMMEQVDSTMIYCKNFLTSQCIPGTIIILKKGEKTML